MYGWGCSAEAAASFKSRVCSGVIANGPLDAFAGLAISQQNVLNHEFWLFNWNVKFPWLDNNYIISNLQQIQTVVITATSKSIGGWDDPAEASTVDGWETDAFWSSSEADAFWSESTGCAAGGTGTSGGVLKLAWKPESAGCGGLRTSLKTAPPFSAFPMNTWPPKSSPAGFAPCLGPANPNEIYVSKLKCHIRYAPKFIEITVSSKLYHNTVTFSLVTFSHVYFKICTITFLRLPLKGLLPPFFNRGEWCSPSGFCCDMVKEI